MRFFLIMFILLIITIVLSLKIGYTGMSMNEFVGALVNSSKDSSFAYIVWDIRLPRMLSAFFVGYALSLSGVILQSILKNQLASPFTLGLSQGAAFGASFSIVFFASSTFTIFGFENINYVVLGAFLGACLSSLAILSLSFIKEITSGSLILAGVALSSFFGALTMLLQYFSSDNELASIVFWTFGDLSRGDYSQIVFLLISVVIASIFTIIKGWDFNAILWDEDYSKSLGVKIVSLRFYSIFIASFLTAVATSFYGIIGFVGLVSPHIIKLIYPHAKHHFLFFASSFLGGVFLMIADLLARELLSPVNLPVGILTSFVGVPLFLYVIIKKSFHDKRF